VIPSADVATDLQGLAQLRHEARTDARSPETLRKVASQFEALLVQQMLKSARAAKLGEGLFESSEHETYTEMFDAQIALKLAQGQGLGIADLLVKQLSGTARPESTVSLVLRQAQHERGAEAAAASGPEAFTRTLWPHAEHAARALGTDPKALVAQAALETGWGRSVIRHPDGRSSFNVFGIKATPDWQGERVRVATLEYENGVAVRRHAEFRAYGSQAEAFADYVKLLRNNPRYADALGVTDPAAFAQALQRAGYATDPAYAEKLQRVMNGAPLQVALSGLKSSAQPPIA
jgi:flagellar protein FlgJ